MPNEKKKFWLDNDTFIVVHNSAPEDWELEEDPSYLLPEETGNWEIVLESIVVPD